MNGKYGTIKGFKLLYKEKEWEKKRDYWMKKGKYRNISKNRMEKIPINTLYRNKIK